MTTLLSSVRVTHTNSLLGISHELDRRVKNESTTCHNVTHTPEGSFTFPRLNASWKKPAGFAVYSKTYSTWSESICSDFEMVKGT